MAQRRFHYEQAFEHFLRANRIPYVAVDEAKKALLPAQGPGGSERALPRSIKSFDFVVYGPGENLLIDVKGRLYKGRTRRFESWVTRDDVASLSRWEELFGSGFVATFVFIYALKAQPPDALFEEFFEYGSRWYALREVRLADYVGAMTERSAGWQTVHVPAEAFARISRPFRVEAVVG